MVPSTPELRPNGLHNSRNTVKAFFYDWNALHTKQSHARLGSLLQIRVLIHEMAVHCVELTWNGGRRAMARLHGAGIFL